MQLVVNTRDLQQAVGVVSHSLGRVGDFDEGLMVTAGQDGITLQTRNENMHIETVIPGNAEAMGSVLLPGKLFIDLVRRLNGDTVTVAESRDNANLITVTSGKTRVNMSKGNPQYFNLSETEIKNKATMRQCDLKQLIDRVRFSAGTDQSRQILTGCLVEISATMAKAVALDGFRMAMQIIDCDTKLDADKPLLKTVIPTPVCAVLSSVLSTNEEDMCDVYISGKNVRLDMGTTQVYANVFIGEYIDYNRIIPTTFETDAVCDRRLLLDCLERAMVVKDAAMNPVRLSFASDMLHIRTQASLSDFADEIPIEMKGNGLDIAFNANFLVAVLRSLSCDNVLIRLNSAVSPCVIVPTTDQENFLYLILPVRM